MLLQAGPAVAFADSRAGDPTGPGGRLDHIDNLARLVVRLRWERGPRVTIFGRRIHHGLIGCLLILHDIRDIARWLPDLLARP